MNRPLPVVRELLLWIANCASNLSEKLSNLESDVTLPPGEWEQMVSELRSEKARADKAEGEAEQWKATRWENIQELDDLKLRCADLNEQIEKMRDAHGPLCEDLNKATDRIAELEQQIATTLDQSHSVIADLEQKLARAHEWLTVAKERIAVLEAEKGQANG